MESRKTIFGQITSAVMAAVMVVGITIPAYAQSESGVPKSESKFSYDQLTGTSSMP